MRRREAVAVVVAALALITAALAWLFGPYGLLGVGLALAVVVLFVLDVKEE